MFVDVPISVHIPPSMAKNDSGIIRRLGLTWLPWQARSTMGRKTATTAVLLMKAETGAMTRPISASNASWDDGPCSSRRSPR